MVLPYNAGYDTLVGSEQPFQYWQPYDGMNLPGGMIGQAAAQFVGNQAMSRAGMVHTGFTQHGNLYNNMRQQMFSQAHYTNMVEAAKGDMQIATQFETNIAHRAGIHIGDAERQNMDAFNSHMLKVAPYMAPSMLDAFTGGRSMSNLMHSMHIGGRHRMDAVSGAMGQSADAALAQARGIYDHYYSDPNDRLNRAAGLTSGEIGGMAQEMMRRGMMAGPGTTRERTTAGLLALQSRFAQPGAGGPDAMAEVLQRGGLSAERRAELSGTSYAGLTDSEISSLGKVSEVKDGVRAADTGRVIRSIDKYKGAISAIKEIFGEEGKTDAPMQELWRALEGFTNGGSSQLQPAKLEATVRNFVNVARTAGFSTEAMGVMMQVSGGQAQELGLNPVFATQMAGNAMAFRAAYNQLGGGDTPAWGLENADALAYRRSQQQGRAIASPVANRMAALSRLEKQYGGFSGRAADYVTRFREGTLTAAEQRQFTDMSEGEFITMFKENGAHASTRDIETAVRNKAANSEELHNHPGMARQVVSMQWEDIRDVALGVRGGAFKSSTSGKLAEMGIRDDGSLSETISGAMADRLRIMDVKTRRESVARNSSMGAAAYESVAAEAARDPGGSAAQFKNKLDSMSDTERDRTLAMMAGGAYDTAERDVGRFGVTHMENLLSVNDPRTQAMEARVRGNAEVSTMLQTMMRGGDPNVYRRFMQSMTATDENGQPLSMAAVIGETLGGENRDKHGTKIAEMLAELHTAETTAGPGQQAAIKAARDQLTVYMEKNNLTAVVDESLEEAEKLKAATGGADGEAGANEFSFEGLTLRGDSIEVRVNGKLLGEAEAVAKADSRGGTEVA